MEACQPSQRPHSAIRIPCNQQKTQLRCWLDLGSSSAYQSADREVGRIPSPSSIAFDKVLAELFWSHNFSTMSSSLAVPFRRRSLHQMTTSGQFGGTGGSAGGCCFWVSSSSSSSSGAVSAFPSSAAKCRSATSSSTNSTILSMMARVSARSGSSSTVGDRSRHLYRRNTAILSKSSGSASSGSGSSGITNCATVMGGPSSALASALSSVTRTARIRPRSYSTTPIVRQQHPKQPGGQKRSQSTIIGVPGGPQSAGGAAGPGRGAGSGTAGAESMLGGAPSGQAGQATWKEIYQLLRERCRVFLLKPRRLVSLPL